MGEPVNKQQARLWIRAYWAGYIRHADMGGVADLQNDFIDAVWGRECRKIAARLQPEPKQ